MPQSLARCNSKGKYRREDSEINLKKVFIGYRSHFLESTILRYPPGFSTTNRIPHFWRCSLATTELQKFATI
jgi:hypothetical protein